MLSLRLNKYFVLPTLVSLLFCNSMSVFLRDKDSSETILSKNSNVTFYYLKVLLIFGTIIILQRHFFSKHATEKVITGQYLLHSSGDPCTLVTCKMKIITECFNFPASDGSRALLSLSSSLLWTISFMLHLNKHFVCQVFI